MNTKELVAAYLASGATITKLPDGEAEGALRLDTKDGISALNSQRSREGWELTYGTENS